MNDIFISYASEDRPRVKPIVKALQDQGWSVWWDRKIPPGRTFSQVIEEAIDAAKCVIVLWSDESVKSDWVQNEAAEGARRKILVPVLIDDVQIPFEFRRIQAADLKEWKAEKDHSGFKILLSSISEIVEPSSLKIKEVEAKRKTAELPKQEEEKNDAKEPKSLPEKKQKQDVQLVKKPKIGWIIVGSLLCISALTIIFLKVLPHYNSRSVPTKNEPGAYLNENALAGAKLDESMVTIVPFTEKGGLILDHPLSYSDVQGFCLLYDLRKGENLTWDNIGECH